MSLFGGIGSNVGNFLQSSQADASAWTAVNKELTGLVKDTIDLSFTQIGANLWKYSADTNLPTLVPMRMERTTTESNEADDSSWKGNYEKLVNNLPPSTKQRLQSQMEQPAESRNPNYTLLNETLTSVAKGMTWMENAEEPVDPKSLEGQRVIHNISLPEIALRGVVEHTQAELQGAESFLNQIGPNDPNHDKLRHFAKETGNLQNRLNEFLQILKDPKEPLPTPKQMNDLNQDIGKLLHEFNTHSLGNYLQILKPMLEAMETVAQALSVHPTSPSLFIGLKMAFQGIFKSDSRATGLIGQNLENLFNALEIGFSAILMKKFGNAKLKMLMMMCMSVLATLGSLASLLRKEKKKNKNTEDEEEEEEEEEKEEDNPFSLLLFLELLKGSKLVHFIFKTIAKACGQDEAHQHTLTEIMELPSLIFMLLMSGDGKPEHVVPLIDEMPKDLHKQMNTTETILNNTFSRNDENMGAKNLKIALQQGQMALNNYESEGFFKVLEGALLQMNGSLEGLQTELKELKEMAIFFKLSFGSGMHSQKVSSTVLI